MEKQDNKMIDTHPEFYEYGTPLDPGPDDGDPEQPCAVCGNCKCVCDEAEWQAISDQLNYWADLDQEYWRRRRQSEYEAYLNRKLKQQ